MDEIVNRVVDRLAEAGVGESDGGDREIEVHVEDEAKSDEEGAFDEGEAFEEEEEDFDEGELGEREELDDRDHGDGEGNVGDAAGRETHPHADHHGHAQHRREEADRRREDARTRKREAKRRAREAREAAAGMENLGDRIEAAVEAQLDHLGEHLEHALGPGPAEPPEPTTSGVIIGPDDTREKAVYKTQLQKGGRVAVPDTEIEALDLAPGDTLQVVLYPVE